MARNEEKANALLNRWLDAKAGILGTKRDPKKRPFLASECNDVAEADKWRSQILREIGKKVMEIQNAGLGEHVLRDLNDEINKLVREKGHWENRIIELGGPNYKKGAKVRDEDGAYVEKATGKGAGYRYYGAAKNLPGVRELFQKEKKVENKRTRYDMYKNIDGDYYGFRDDEDGILDKLEGEAQKKMRAAEIEKWDLRQKERAQAEKDLGISAQGDSKTGADGASAEMPASDFVAHVPLPDQKEIERMVITKKKQDLLSKYVSPEIAKSEAEAKAMLNKKG
mmetsp:Transcript_7975/g.29501  ORF Transcript_7975/g.29501 Transcript_7975/m.29501 type:complete len:282 (-) Transcript_7975:38-883(-)